jgi:predicted Zn finger-like uncharacterized protein
MSMTTQCPSCSTTFRVTPQQLQSQQGMVRCGRCATVFDGFKALSTLPEEVRKEVASPVVLPPLPEAIAPITPIVPQPKEAVAPSVSALPPTVAAPVAAQSPVIDEPPHAAPDAFIEPVAQPDEVVAPLASAYDAGASEQKIADIPDEPVPAPEALPEVEAVSERLDTSIHAPPPSRSGVFWAFGAVLLLAVLAAQFIYLYRGEIAANVPEARPLLNAWCRPLNCAVALPQRPRQITIEASDMQAVDAANASLIMLTATLRNQAGIALGYPALDVVLTNTRDHTVARRIFLPNEYMAGNRDWRAGIAPSAEVTIRLSIDSGDLGAAGFRLELLAAPAS